MTYLVDANVLSEATKLKPASNVIEWLRANERELVVNPIILGEIQYGVFLLANGRRKRRLQQWFDGGIRRIHCLPWMLLRVFDGQSCSPIFEKKAER